MINNIPSPISEQSLEAAGKAENIKNQAEKKELDKQKVNELVKMSNRCIIKISSAFPWNLFPNTIEVEESRVTFITRQLLSSQSHSVEIKDISNVFLESSLLFSTIQVVSRTFIKNNIKINYLHKGKAKKVKMIIEGLRTFDTNNIDTSNYEIGELISKLSELHTNESTPNI
ncbi:MAG TPA: hypothetical protein VLE91_04810 [Candidatus Saccharimonadales bacterium]|nr:hypothetical protein [Candidatus Saccharimonadales bacterium]